MTTKKKAPAKKKVVKKKAIRKKRIRPSVAKNDGRNGGARKGSGRKQSKSTRRTRKIANELAESGELSPLEYMLSVMRETSEELKAKFDKEEIDREQYLVGLAGLQKRRYEAAKDACPYIHPRLSSVEQTKGGEHESWLEVMEKEAGL